MEGLPTDPGSRGESFTSLQKNLLILKALTHCGPHSAERRRAEGAGTETEEGAVQREEVLLRALQQRFPPETSAKEPRLLSC